MASDKTGVEEPQKSGLEMFSMIQCSGGQIKSFSFLIILIITTFKPVV